MKKILLVAGVLAALLPLNAQDLPMPSPTATLSQRIGLTDFTVVYSRPGVKDRAIFGELVPYGKMWRTGANMNTTVEFSTDVTIGGIKVPAGKYSFFTIPDEHSWEIILNSKTDHSGTSGYDKANDVARFSVKPNYEHFMETFTIEFNSIINGTANMVLSWDKTHVLIPVKVDVIAQAEINIENAIANASEEDKWRVYRNSANYYMQNRIELDQALEYMNLSIAANNKSWYSYWLLAEIQAEKGDKKSAVKSAKTALKMGTEQAEEKGEEFGYAKLINEDIEMWKAK